MTDRELQDLRNLGHDEAADEIDRLRALAESEGTRAVNYLRRARTAEAEKERLRFALEAMLTQFGLDEDEWSKPTFDKAREALTPNVVLSGAHAEDGEAR